MPNDTLASVSIPKELMERADRLMERFPELGFRSRGRLVAAAVQEYLANLERQALTMQSLKDQEASTHECGLPACPHRPRKRRS